MYKGPSKAQKIARERNWKIFRLRSCVGLMYGTPYEAQWAEAIDGVLRSLGAETIQEHRDRLYREAGHDE